MTKMVISQLGSFRLLVFIMAQARAECIPIPSFLQDTHSKYILKNLGSLLKSACEI